MAEPRVVVGLWGLLSTALGIVVVLGGLGAWLLDSKIDGVRDVIDGMSDDIAEVRSDIDSLEQKADSTITDVNTKDGEVREQIANLVPALTEVVTRLEGVTVNLEGLSTSVASIREDLNVLQVAFAEANARQVSFEKWIVGRNTNFESLPDEWRAEDIGIGNFILESPNPLRAWGDIVLPK